MLRSITPTEAGEILGQRRRPGRPIEVGQGGLQVGQVDQGQLLVVGILEDQGQDALLGLVELQDLGQQDRPERADVGSQADPLATLVEGLELDRIGPWRPVADPDLGQPAGDVVVHHGRRAEAADVAFDVDQEDRHAGVR
jgi:hypothetical protein